MPGSIAFGFAGFQRLVGGHVGEHLGVDVLDVLHAGRARPARPGLVRRAAGQDEAGVGVVEIGEQAFAVRAGVHPVELGNVAGREHAALFADVGAGLDHLRALGRTEVHRRRQRRVELEVGLRRLDERHQLRVVRLAPRQRLHRVDRPLQRLIVELVRRGARGLLSVTDGDRHFLIVLDQVGGDARVRKARRGSFAAGEAHFHRVGLAHVQDLVGDLFDFVFRVSHALLILVRRGGAATTQGTNNLRTGGSTRADAWDAQRQRVTPEARRPPARERCSLRRPLSRSRHLIRAPASRAWPASRRCRARVDRRSRSHHSPDGHRPSPRPCIDRERRPATRPRIRRAFRPARLAPAPQVHRCIATPRWLQEMTAARACGRAT